MKHLRLWFDVGIKRYTTILLNVFSIEQLWFDVGIKRYTTVRFVYRLYQSCGLM